MQRLTILALILSLLSHAAVLSPAQADAAPPAPAAKPAEPAPDPVAAALQPCAEGKDPESTAVACTNLIATGQLTGRPLGAAYVFRGKAQAQRNQLPAAIEDFSSALKIDPEATDALYNRAAAYALMGRDDLALEDFARLLKIAPHDADSLYYRAQIYAREGKYETAITDLDSVLELVPEDFEARLQRAGFDIMLTRYADAIGDLDRLLKATPAAPAALYNRGRAKFLNRDFAGAGKDFAAAMQNRSENPYAALRLYLATARAGKVDPAPLAAAAKAFPADQWPLPIVAFYQGKLGEDDLLAAAKSGDPAADLTAEAQYYLGAWALAKGDTAAARTHFQAALDAKADRANLDFIDAGLELKALGAAKN